MHSNIILTTVLLASTAALKNVLRHDSEALVTLPLGREIDTPVYDGKPGGAHEISHGWSHGSNYGGNHHANDGSNYGGSNHDSVHDVGHGSNSKPYPGPQPYPHPGPFPGPYPGATPGHDPGTHPGTEPDDVFIDWKTFKGNGVNLGAWLEKERTHDPIWWVDVGGDNATDEWTLCEILGAQCGPIFEARYASFLNTSTIDQLATVDVNVLRIPTTYAAWISVPGSQLYSGHQQSYLRTITNYAIEKYNMHIILGLHSLPGGVNNLDIGEALLHDNWFYNTTNLDYSYQAVDRLLHFITTSGHISSFTVAPINEASDNLAGFGSPAGLSDNAVAWINTYINGVFDRIATVDTRIPLMLQDCFKGASFWAPFYNSTANLVIDSHIYYFAAAGTYAQYVPLTVCGQAQYLAEETKFPVFVGEWSLQSMFNNSLADRPDIFDTQRYAWEHYVAGGSFWTAISYSPTPVDGEGTIRDYWSYIDLINAGVITPPTNASFCAATA